MPSELRLSLQKTQMQSYSLSNSPFLVSLSYALTGLISAWGGAKVERKNMNGNSRKNNANTMPTGDQHPC